MSEYVYCSFTDAATPAIGLSPVLDAWDLSDSSREIDSASMTNVASSGFYSYDISSLDMSKPLVFRADGGEALVGFERWRWGGIGAFRALRRNVALDNLPFQMVLSTDHVTPATGKTVTAKIKKDAGPFATCTNAVSEISSGWYEISLTKTERDADTTLLSFTATGCDTRGIVLLSE